MQRQESARLAMEAEQRAAANARQASLTGRAAAVLSPADGLLAASLRHPPVQAEAAGCVLQAQCEITLNLQLSPSGLLLWKRGLCSQHRLLIAPSRQVKVSYLSPNLAVTQLHRRDR